MPGNVTDANQPIGKGCPAADLARSKVCFRSGCEWRRNVRGSSEKSQNPARALFAFLEIRYRQDQLTCNALFDAGT
jgi:hypothetical protein